MARIRGILFDLGDTLLDFGKVDILGMFEQGAALGYEYLKSQGLPLPPYARFFRKQLWAIRWNYFKSRFTRREFNSLDLLGKISMQMGHSLSREQMLELAWQFYLPLSRQAKLEPGSAELLRSLKDSGYILGLVSNTFLPSEVLDRHLRETGLLELLPFRVYSCEVLYRKPSPSIFAVALERAGLRAEEALFVGDSLDADILGANRAGLVSVLKDPAQRHGLSRIRPRYRITGLQDLLGIIERHT